MSGRTAPILRGLGNTRRLTVLALLAQTEDGLTNAELRRSSGLARSTLSNTLTDLEAIGLVVRPDRNRGIWRCSARAATRRFLATAAELAVCAAASPLEEDQELAERFAAPPPT